MRKLQIFIQFSNKIKKCYLFSIRVIFHEFLEISKEKTNFTNYAILNQFCEIALSWNSRSLVTMMITISNNEVTIMRRRKGSWWMTMMMKVMIVSDNDGENQTHSSPSVSKRIWFFGSPSNWSWFIKQNKRMNMTKYDNSLTKPVRYFLNSNKCNPNKQKCQKNLLKTFWQCFITIEYMSMVLQLLYHRDSTCRKQ